MPHDCSLAHSSQHFSIGPRAANYALRQRHSRDRKAASAVVPGWQPWRSYWCTAIRRLMRCGVRSSTPSGLSLLATEDPYIGQDDHRRRAADRAGASTAVL